MITSSAGSETCETIRSAPGKAVKMKESMTSRTYDLWSLVYDRTFGRLVHKRQQRALDQLHLRSGDRLLDIGVGTGLTLEHYPPDVHVVGMDLSAGMLAKAKQKQVDLALAHCSLIRADAMTPPFAEASFDHVVISHTVSVVSDPGRLLRWAARLIRPGGRIVVLNHFCSTDRIIALFERILSPLCVKLGWRSDLSLEDVLRGVDLEVEYYFKLRQWDIWKIVVLAHRRSGAAFVVPMRTPVEPVAAAALTQHTQVPGTALAVDSGS